MAHDFIDTSALVKDDHSEPRSAGVDQILGEPGPNFSIARWTLAEVTSVFAIATSTVRPDSSFARLNAFQPGQENGRSSPAWNPPRRQGCGQTEAEVGRDFPAVNMPFRFGSSGGRLHLDPTTGLRYRSHAR